MQHCKGHIESGHGGLWAQQSLCFSVLALCEVFVQFRWMDLQQTKIILPSLSLDFHTRHGILRRHCGCFETSFHTKVTLQSTTAVSHRGRGWPRQEHAWQKLWDGGRECRQMWNPGASNVGVSVKAACACVVYVILRVFCVTLWGLIIIAPQIIKSYRLELKSKIWFEVMVKVWIWLSKRVGIKSNQCKNSDTTLSCYLCVRRWECGLSSLSVTYFNWSKVEVVGTTYRFDSTDKEKMTYTITQPFLQIFHLIKCFGKKGRFKLWLLENWFRK